MPQNCVRIRERIAVVHQPGTKPYTPERRRAQLVLSGVERRHRGQRGVRVLLSAEMLLRGLHDAIACTNVVQQEITVRVEHLIAERRRNGIRAAQDRGARWRGGEGADMTGPAADLIE